MIEMLSRFLDNLDDEAVKGRVRDRVKAMCGRLPVYR